jgi:hypothetical protein
LVLLFNAEGVYIRLFKNFAQLRIAVVQDLELLLYCALLGFFSHFRLLFVSLNFKSPLLAWLFFGLFRLFFSRLSIFDFVFGSVEYIRAFFKVVLPFVVLAYNCVADHWNVVDEILIRLQVFLGPLSILLGFFYGYLNWLGGRLFLLDLRSIGCDCAELALIKFSQ